MVSQIIHKSYKQAFNDLKLSQLNFKFKQATKKTYMTSCITSVIPYKAENLC